MDNGNWDIRPADTAQSVLHPLPLGLQFLRIGHVPELAAAAGPIIRAVRLDAGGGGLHQRFNAPPGGVVADVLKEHLRPLPPERTLDEYRHALDAGHALAAAGVAVDDSGVYPALLQHCACPLASALCSLWSSFFRRLEKRSSSLYTQPQYFCIYSPRARASSWPSLKRGRKS